MSFISYRMKAIEKQLEKLIENKTFVVVTLSLQKFLLQLKTSSYQMPIC